jgi:hypothetical protein
VRAIEGGRAPAPTGAAERKPSAPPQSGAGSRWTSEEEQRLAMAFDTGKTIGELAKLHNRSTAGIEARLLKLGKIDASALTVTLRYPPKVAGEAQRAR